MTSNGVSSALELGVSERGRALLALPEDQWFDRKSFEVPPKKLATALIGFANAEGGVVVVGLSDGKVQGLVGQSRRENELRQAAIDFTRPVVSAKYELVDCVSSTGKADQLLLIDVQPSDSVHELTDGDCFLRVGDETRKLTFALRQELEYDRGQAKFEATVVKDRDLSSLDARTVLSYKAKAGSNDTNERFLAGRGLLTQHLEMTAGLYLLFGRQPQDLYPNAHVRVLRYLTTSRGSGSRQALDDDADFRIEGSIPQVISGAAKIIDDLVPRRRALDEDGRFEGEPIVPREAWLEGLVNAVVHRSYSISGDHIRVEIFPDRIEIVSPGRFPGLADLTRPLDVVRYARNPRIARVCADLRIGQELGEGIRRIFEEMRLRGLDDPAYAQGSANVRLTLSSRRRLNDRVAGNLPLRAREILGTLRRKGRPLSTGDIASLTGVARPTAKKHLDLLRAASLVKWVGTSPKDPSATWEPTD